MAVQLVICGPCYLSKKKRGRRHLCRQPAHLRADQRRCRQMLGHNNDGQLGDRSNNPSNIPKAVFGLSAGISAITVGGFHSAQPAANQRVAAWSDVDQTPAVASLDNVLTMPANDQHISVSYEPCFTLTTSKSGEGAVPLPSEDPPSEDPPADDEAVVGQLFLPLLR